MVNHPFDVAPARALEAKKTSTDKPDRDATSSRSRTEPDPAGPEAATDAETTAWLDSPKTPSEPDRPRKDGYIQPVAWINQEPEPIRSGPMQPPGLRPIKLDLQLPPQFPGSEVPRVEISRDPAVAAHQIETIYPDLPRLPVEPKVQPGPEGKPYSLADFQRLAAGNSPTLRQAVSDVEAAKGNLIQAKTYPNPTVGYLVDPSNNNSTAGVQGGFIDQPIITGGKMRLGVAAAQKDLDNAILALKRARSDLATSVRNAYFTLLVDIETVIVTRAQVQFADDVFRLQTGLLKGAQAAPYEPTALRAQAFTNRLAYKQAIASYMYDWKALVATIGLKQLPLSEISGQVDRFIPYYDYDEVLAHVMQNHTDVITARNVTRKAQFNLKIQQVTPIFPNLDVRYSLEKDFVLGPFGTYQTLGLGFPLPIWDQNKGNIIAAQAALLRAGEESHRVEVNLTNNLAAAYANYRNNLYALEYYRRSILPDLVRYYRGVFERRQVDPSSAFGDLVFAQQNLSTNVTAYIGVLSALWSSVVSVADFLQTDDLFQLAKRRELPETPDFKQMVLPDWACGHTALAAGCIDGACATELAAAHPHAGAPPVAAGAPAPLAQPPASASPSRPAAAAPGESAGPGAAAPRPSAVTGKPDAAAGDSEKRGLAKSPRQSGSSAASQTTARSYFADQDNDRLPKPRGFGAQVNALFGKEEDHDGQGF
jgi:cobalt-zinc-cadmium efflux system outer membrane protein